MVQFITRRRQQWYIFTGVATSHWEVPQPRAYWYVFTYVVFIHLINLIPGTSADDALQEKGSITGICYLEDCEEYLKILDTDSRRKRWSILKITSEWDNPIFPNTTSSIVGASAEQWEDLTKVRFKRPIDQLDDGSEDDNDSTNVVGS